MHDVSVKYGGADLSCERECYVQPKPTEKIKQDCIPCLYTLLHDI
jgi:hypothetical protein